MPAVLNPEGSVSSSIPDVPSRGCPTAGVASIALISAYAALTALAYHAFGIPSFWRRLFQPQFLLAIPAGALLTIPVVVMRIRRQVRDATGQRIPLIVPAWREAWKRLPRERIVYVAGVSVLTALFLNAFIAWKNLLPSVHPFAFDASLARWDSALHGGESYRFFTWLPIWLIDPLYYYAWTIGLIAGVLAFAWAGNTRGLLAILLSWILLGTVLATVVSSAGPPYYTGVTGQPSPYTPLFTWLATARHGHAAFALEVQRSLWNVHQAGAVVSGTGISAFPSMHVATAATFALAARGRWIRGLLAVYTMLILVGSVELGWHYALDGYAAIGGSVVIWWLTRRLFPTAPSSGPLV